VVDIPDGKALFGRINANSQNLSAQMYSPDEVQRMNMSKTEQLRSTENELLEVLDRQREQEEKDGK